MNRRAFLGTLGLLAAPVAAEAQPTRKVARLGLLGLFAPELGSRSVAAVREGLSDLGWREGQNVHFEARYASGNRGQLEVLARELVQRKPDVIVTFGTAATRAARAATSSIPIVMAAVADPIGSEFVTSLARPGGNVTGLSLLQTDLIGKQFELLQEVAPHTSRIGVISLRGLRGLEGSAPWEKVRLDDPNVLYQYIPARVRVQPIILGEPVRLDGLAPQLKATGVNAVLGVATPALDDVRTRVVEIVNARGLPSIFGLTYWVEAGGLMSYSADLYAVQRRAATYVDKILKGAKPADLPVEQPTKFELVINLKTAKALGLTIPPSLLLRADQVIE